MPTVPLLQKTTTNRPGSRDGTLLSKELPSLRVLDFLGYNEVVLKCDQESSLVKVIENAKTHRGPHTQTMVEHSAVGDSQANGLIERANRSVEGQVRTMISALEEKLNSKINGTDTVIPWLILHAGTILNVFTVGKEGKTPHERLREGNRSGNSLSLARLFIFCR